QRLLLDLLDLDRLRHGLLNLAVERTDFAALVRRVATSVEPDGSIQVDAAPIDADVDPGKLERIVENLLANAKKHTASGTRISLSLSVEHDGLLVCVDDEGPGIPDAQKQELFEPFVRGDSSSLVPGTGIGLALVAQFSALQGGRAWVQDNA